MWPRKGGNLSKYLKFYLQHETTLLLSGNLTLFSLFFLQQGIVIGIGENSEFGEIFKLMKAEEVNINF